jgi:XapX domain-containing protein
MTRNDMMDASLSVGNVLLALATGLAVGVVFSLVKLPSPAPPLLGLIGLVGMFAGQRLIPVISAFLHKGT